MPGNQHPHGFNPQKYINTLQEHRAGLAFRDEKYDLHRAEVAKDPKVREFYKNEARIDHTFGNARLVAARTGKPLRAYPNR